MKRKKSCVVPVITAQRKKLNFKIPLGLNALIEVKFYPENKQFERCLQSHFNYSNNKLQIIEERLLRERFTFIKQQMTHLKINESEKNTTIEAILSRDSASHNGKEANEPTSATSSNHNLQQIPRMESSRDTMATTHNRDALEVDGGIATANNSDDLEVDGGIESTTTVYPRKNEVKTFQSITSSPYFLKKTDDKDLMRNYKIVSKASESVGCICGAVSTGTGFRVGAKYFATARHVVWDNVAIDDVVDPQKVTSNSFYVKFEYLRPNDIPRIDECFYFTDIVYENSRLDVAILEMREEAGKSFPVPIRVISDVNRSNPVYIIGHPHGQLQTLDPKIQFYTLDDNQVEQSVEWAKSQGIDARHAYDDIENKAKVLFDCASQHGASGGLGVMVARHSDEPEAVLMLLRGYPGFLYQNLSFSDEEKEKFLITEQGVLLSSVYEDIQSDSKYNDLVSDINSTLKD